MIYYHKMAKSQKEHAQSELSNHKKSRKMVINLQIYSLTKTIQVKQAYRYQVEECRDTQRCTWASPQ